MFILPFIMEYEGPSNSRPVQENKKVARNLNFYDYIYLQRENELLKFKVELDHMNVVDALENYIDGQKQSDFSISNEKEIEESSKIPLKFLKYVGKYRLEHNLIKTKNYLVPRSTYLLNLLTDKYDNEILNTINLEKLKDIKTDATLDENDFDLNIIKILLSDVNVELVDKYVIDEKEIEVTIANIKMLVKDDDARLDVLNNLKWILESSKTNEECIFKLGLQEKFDRTLNKCNKKQKVK